MQRKISLVVLCGLIGVILLACDLASLGTSKPTVIISSPPSGSQFHEGEDVTIQSTSTDSAGISRVELVVDDTVIRIDPAPGTQVSYPLVQTWKAAAGNHKIGVRAYNKSGAASDPAIVSVSVIAGVAAATPTTLPTPIATSISSSSSSAPKPTTAPVATCTNNADFVSDVTVPDGTAVVPNQAFNKVWRVKNTGTCTWGSGYQFVFVSGKQMTTTASVSVPSTVPGATADLAVMMVAPTTMGSQTSYWRLKAPSGTLFGDSVLVNVKVTAATPTSTAPATQTSLPTPTATITKTPTPPATCATAPTIGSFTASSTSISAGQVVTLTWGAVLNADTARIDPDVEGIPAPGSTVVTPTVTTTYILTATGCGGTTTKQVTIQVGSTGSPTPTTSLDFVARGPEARWTSCAIDFPTLSWNGQDGDALGFVKPRPNTAMENGTAYPLLLETHPNADPNGCISGTYPNYTVQANDRFKAKIGFLQGATAGNVTFQLNYYDLSGSNPNTVRDLGAWTKSYNGTLIDVNVDLAPIVGHNVKLALAILAGPSAAQDWATWVAPRVEH